MTAPVSIWTDELTDMLSWLIDQKQSAKAASDFLTATYGFPITKNMCVAKARRIGIFFCSVPPPKKSKVGPGKVIKIRKARAGAPTWTKAPLPAANAVAKTTLFERRPNQCPYPFEGFAMCGDPKDVAAPYCHSHMRLCYRPVQTKEAA